jgi:hypothetical protein
MEPKISLSCWKEPASGPYTEQINSEFQVFFYQGAKRCVKSVVLAFIHCKTHNFGRWFYFRLQVKGEPDLFGRLVEVVSGLK